MPVRSIKLKLVVPRHEKYSETRKSIWDTHNAVNLAVRYYEERLLIMRGTSYTMADDQVVKQSKVQSQLISMVRRAQKTNGLPEPINSASKLTDLVRELYECIVPSAIGKDGNAQQANSYLNPLTDPMSTGYLSIFDKLCTIPKWVSDLKEEGDAPDVTQAHQWLKTPEGQRRMKEPGAPPKWRKLLKVNDVQWVNAFVDDVRRKQKEVEGAPRIICSLMEEAVLPLFPAYFASRLDGYNEYVSRWDRLAFRLAVGHLLSWESWCRIAGDEHRARRQRIEDFEDTHITKDIEGGISVLRRYEEQRQSELLEEGALPMDRSFRITLRQIRGWSKLREKWLKSPGKLEEVTRNQQTKFKGRFGDPHLFRWLAKERNHDAWKGKKDILSIHARLNAMRGILERSRSTAIMTLPDAIEHPRYIQWEAEGGSNLRNYRLGQTEAGLKVKLPLLQFLGDGLYNESTSEYLLAPSGQLRAPRLETVNGKVHIKYRSVLDEEYIAELGAADLLFDRQLLTSRHPELIGRGEIGSVYLKLSLDIAPLLPDGWVHTRHPAVTHFLTAKGSNQHRKKVSEGVRVLSVDLGVRSFGACSVFQLGEKEPPNTRLSFYLEDLELWAVHERSFLLELPGEYVGLAGLKWQEEQQAELRHLRSALRRYRALYQLQNAEVDVRKTMLDEIGNHEYPFESEIRKNLYESVNLPNPLWLGEVNKALKNFRHAFGSHVHSWRKANRNKATRKFMGKSFWSIQHLQDTRRFLYSWSHLGRFSGDICRADRDKRGVHAAQLLSHIGSIKEDRLKTGSDLIVQAARGYQRIQGKWSKAYEPCHIILFEDLSRYLMRTDRPKRENSQLMKWAHRSVPQEVKMQGELYGIHVCDTSASFSSRFHTKTHAPGIRCRAITKKDLEDPFIVEIIERENPSLQIAECKVGDLVPLSGGEIFVSMKDDRQTTQIHADINAAQNLQRRFWTRHGDAYRIPCRNAQLDGKEIWLPRSFGKRMKGALGSFGYLLPTNHESGSCRWVSISAPKWRALSGAEVPREEIDPELIDIVAIEEEALELNDEHMAFFRDPSNIILPDGLWYPSPVFWGIVKRKISNALQT